MPTNILMPALSPTMEKGNLAKWLKKEGDRIKSGDVIAEIETDKATMEFEAVDEGVLGKILVPEGTQDVAINQPIAILLADGEKASDISAAPQAKPAAKAAVASPTPAASGGPSAVGGGTTPAAATPAQSPAVAPARAPSSPGTGEVAARSADGRGVATNGTGRVFASPLARRLAKEAGIDVARITGSGPHGRIVKTDIEAAQSGRVPLAAKASGAQEARSAGGATGTPTMSDAQIMKLFDDGEYDVIPHDNVRKIIARRLVEAKTTIPHFYLTVDTEIDALLKLRADLNAAAPMVDGKPKWRISVNDLIIKALAMALMRVPDANVTWTESGMLRHKRADIGVAVSIPGGLITPVVRYADTKRISDIAIEMKDLAARARVKKLAPHEYQGGSSAVSNLGMFGIKDFAAVINPPHATILAVGAGIETPVVRDGKVEIRTIMTCTLSTDHRAVDGALGAQLFTAFKELIERPAGMLA
jgi:pyruvate dehydrogenase E2 component (dihydrolipoamide acetyltransferase)